MNNEDRNNNHMQGIHSLTNQIKILTFHKTKNKTQCFVVQLTALFFVLFHCFTDVYELMTPLYKVCIVFVKE